VRPRAEHPPGVGLAAVGPGHLLVELEPPVEAGVGGIPGECVVVGVARRDHSVGCARGAHRPQRADRIGEVLEHLVRVHDVERAAFRVEGVEVERVHVADGEGRVVDALRGGVAGGGSDDLGRQIDAHHGAGCDETREVERDGAGTAADVEHPQPRSQVRQQVRGGVLRGAPAVRAQHALVVPVGVSGPVAVGGAHAVEATATGASMVDPH